MDTVVKAIIVLVIAAWIIWRITRRKAWEKQYREAFESVFSGLSEVPRYEQGFNYGYPDFVVTFASESDLQENKNNGLTERFKSRIAELCKDRGSRKRPFDAEQAIWFTYEGELDEEVARAKEEIARLKKERD